MDSIGADTPVAGDPEPASGLPALFRGFGALAVSSVLGQLIGVVALAYVVRYTGPAYLGSYVIALVVVTYVNLVASVGIDYAGSRDIAQRRFSPGVVVAETLLLQAALAAVCYVALAAGSTLAGSSVQQNLLLILGLILITTTFTVDWALIPLRRSGLVATARLVGQVAYGIVILLVIAHGATGIERYAWANVAGLAVAAGIMTIGLARSPAVRLGVRSTAGLFERLGRSVPFGSSLILIQVYGGIAPLIIGLVSSTHEVGIYSVASKLPAAIVSMATLWSSVFFPHATERLLEDRGHFAADLWRVMGAACVVGLALSVGAALCAEPLMVALFGEAFRASAAPFALLTLSASLVLIQVSYSNVLLAGGQHRFFIGMLATATCGLIVLYVLAATRWGATGAAGATVVGEILLTTGLSLGARRLVGRPRLDWPRLRRGGYCVGAMALVMVIVAASGSVVSQGVAGAATFVVAAWRLEVFDPTLVKR